MGTGLRRSVAAAACGLAFGLAGCGADSDQAPKAEPVGEARAGTVAQLAECSDWTAASREERTATLAVIKAAVNLEDGTGETPELSDDAAYRLLDTTCAEDFAARFRLYKVYARATGFASFAE